MLCLVCSIILLTRILSWSFVDSAVFVLLSGYAVLNALRFGQPYILVSVSCILGYYAYCKGRPLLAGMCFGLFTPIKYFPASHSHLLCIPEGVEGGARRSDRNSGIVTSVSIGVLGWKIHEDFLSSVLGNHLIGKLDYAGPFYRELSVIRFALSSAIHFRRDVESAAVVRSLPRLQGIGVLITKASILLAAIATLVKLARSGATTATAPSIGILGILTLLLAPATATYHFVLLWLPVGLLIGYFFRERAPAVRVLHSWPLRAHRIFSLRADRAV